MGNIIRLSGDPHQETQHLLPWYANGTLDADEAATVEAHLAGCAECRADLATERALGVEVASMPIDVEQGWAAMRSRIEARDRAAPSPVVPIRPRRTSFFRRPVPVGWALTAQAAAAILMVGATRLSGPAAQPLYHALGSTPVSAPGNVVVIFRPDTAEQDLRGALLRSGARLVGGPTASDAYVLRVADAERGAAIARLRSNGHVVLAEPIDEDAQP
jgi:anti-sigma factor RsiW